MRRLVRWRLSGPTYRMMGGISDFSSSGSEVIVRVVGSNRRGIGEYVAWTPLAARASRTSSGICRRNSGSRGAMRSSPAQ